MKPENFCTVNAVLEKLWLKTLKIAQLFRLLNKFVVDVCAV